MKGTIAPRGVPRVHHGSSDPSARGRATQKNRGSDRSPHPLTRTSPEQLAKMSSALVTTDADASKQPIRTFPVPSDCTSRVVKPDAGPPLEVLATGIVNRANHFMVAPKSTLGDVRWAAFHDKKLVPDIVDDTRFLGAVEILKCGYKREIVCRVISQEFYSDFSKLNKAERHDVAHCIVFNDATVARIKENYKSGKYFGDDDELSISEKANFDDFFALDEKHCRLAIDRASNASEMAEMGYMLSTAFAAIDKSTNTLSTRMGKEAKKKRLLEEQSDAIAELQKRARWVHDVSMTKTGQVILTLNVKNESGFQRVVVAEPLLEA